MPGLEGITLGRYELHKLVGRGGMADVYEGFDSHMERRVAVKVFKREDEEMLGRFIREAHLMASFRNEHLVAVFDSGESTVGNVTWYYIVMPFMEGGTLRSRIRRAPLSLEEACRRLREIASALDYIHHQGIIHRDIKSSNVLLDAEGRAYLADFGIARTATDATQLTATGNVLGTVDYVAPELFESNHKADVRSDLYSLGVLLFEMVTGELPFTAENQIAVVSMHMHKPPPAPHSIVHTIPPGVEGVVLKALEKNPALRYGSATELAEAFCHAVSSRTVGEVPLVEEYNDAATLRIPGSNAPHGGNNKIVLPPVPPLAANPAMFRPAPLSNATETTQYGSPHYAAAPSPVSLGYPRNNQPHQQAAAGGYPPDAHRTARRHSRGSGSNRYLVAFIIALITLLIVIVPSIYIATHQGPGGNSTPGATATLTSGVTAATTPSPTATNTPNATATAQAIAHVTATANAQATAAAIAHATATANAQASATAGVISTATSGTPGYADALNDPTNAGTIAANWDGIDGSNSHCTFKSDGYHVTEGVNLVNFHGCRETGHTYKNATIAVDMSMISGHSGGLFFRVTTDSFNNYSGYLFEADSKGNYKISTVSGTTITPLAGHDWSATGALKQGYNVKNTLQVIMQNNTFLFYINGTFLTQATDTTYVDAGDIALLATTTDAAADVVYSNLKVYPLP